jgi:hypothetical protein
VPGAGAPSAPTASPATESPRTTLSLSGRKLVVASEGITVELDLGCEGRSVVRAGARAYVACGSDGVIVVDLEGPRAPAIAGRLPVEGEAVGLFVHRKQPWVEIARLEARPLAGSLMEAPTGAPSGRPSDSRPSSLRVEGEAVQSSDSRPSRVAPPRVGGVTELSLGGVLFLTVGDLGLGGFGKAALVHRFGPPFAIRADLAPFGFGTGKAGAVGVFTGTGTVSVDTDFFEVGVGFGGTTLPNQPRIDYVTGAALATSSPTSSVVVANYLRFGARDGLYLDGRTSIMVRDKSFEFGSIAVEMQIPVADRWGLRLHGGGGNMGTAEALVTMRYRITETRGPGAAFVSGGGGFGFVEGSGKCSPYDSGNTVYYSCARPTYAGPALALAGEWRF